MYIIKRMYRIYMPVDLVIAITHNKMRRHNSDRVKKAEVGVVQCKEHEEREKCNNSDNVKRNKCLDIFRLW